MELLDRIESGKSCQTLRGNQTKSSRTCGSFGAVLTYEIAGSRTNSSARNIVKKVGDRQDGGRVY